MIIKLIMCLILYVKECLRILTSHDMIQKTVIESFFDLKKSVIVLGMQNMHQVNAGIL